MDIIKTILLVIVVIAAAAVGLIKGDFFSADQKTSQTEEYDETIALPSDRYPETAKHIKDAINEGTLMCAPSTETELRNAASNH